MPFQTLSNLFSADESALLLALGSPLDRPVNGVQILGGARRLRHLAKSDNPSFQAWASVLDRATNKFTLWVQQNPDDPISRLALLAANARALNDTARLLTSINDPSIRPPSQTFATTAALCFFYAAERGTAMPDAVGQLLRMVHRLSFGRDSVAPRSSESRWVLLRDFDLLDTSRLRQLVPLGDTSTFARAVGQLAGIVEAGLSGPKLKSATHGQRPPAATDALVDGDQISATLPPAARQGEPPSAVSKEADMAPFSIQGRIKDAQHATTARKLGVQRSWDRLSVAELTAACRALRAHLESPGTSAIKRLAAATALSLHFGREPVHLLAVSVDGGGEIHVDLEQGLIRWDHHAYVQTRELVAEATRWHCVPLPTCIATALQEIRLERSATDRTRTLGELLVDEPHETWVKRQREFTRNLVSSTARRSYSARLAGSLGPAMLSITGSEWAAALVAQDFSALAPAAPYYLNVSHEWIFQSCDRVYRALGLGEAVKTSGQREARAGSSIYQTNQEVRRGVEAAVAVLTDRLKSLQSAESASVEKRALRVDVGVLCGALLVTLVGGRGSRIDELSVIDVLGHPACLSIQDKERDDGGSAGEPARLIPKTKAVAAVITLWMRVREACDGPTHGWKGDCPFFSIESQDWTLSVAELRACIREVFNGPLNVGRHWLLSTLTERGVNRHVIRTISGHARRVTNVFGWNYGVAPLDGVQQSRAALEPIHDEVGSSLLALVRGQEPRLCIDTSSRLPSPAKDLDQPAEITHQEALNELLPGLSGQTLAAASAIDTIRALLLEGDAIAPLHPCTTLTLGLVVFDGHFSADSVLSAVRDIESFTQYGCTPGLWVAGANQRRPRWLPCTAVTTGLLQAARASTTKPHIRTIQQQIQNWLQTNLPNVAWPSEPAEVLPAVIELALRWRRLTLPPDVFLVNHPRLDGATLNSHSLERASGQRIASFRTGAPSAPLQPKRLPHSDFMASAIRLVGHIASSRRRLGEERQRAILMLAKLPDLCPISGFELSIHRYLRWEADLVMRNDKRRIEHSTVSTYLSALGQIVRGLSAGTDEELSDLLSTSIEDWSTDDWLNLLAAATREASSTHNRVAVLNRLSMFARANGLPAPRLQVDQGQPTSHASAADALILEDDITAVRDQIEAALCEQPMRRSIALLRFKLLVELGPRAGELSSLPFDCLTLEPPAITFVPTGFSAQKTDAARRYVPISSELAQHVKQHQLLTKKVMPHADLLFRGRGETEQVSDELLLADWTMELLKRHVGDDGVRAHSLRAHRVMESTYPQWRDRLMELLAHGPRVSWATYGGGAWRDTSRDPWLRLATAASEAGHTSTLSAIQSYVSCGPLMQHILLTRSLEQLHGPSPSWLDGIGLNGASFRKARNRAQQQGSRFHAWDWMVNSVCRPTQPSPLPLQTTTATKRKPPKVAPLAPGLVDALATYLVLGETSESLAHRLQVDHARVLQVNDLLEGHLPSELVLWGRSRTAIGPTGIRSTHALALTQLGVTSINWVSSLSDHTVHMLTMLCRRNTAARQIDWTDPRTWRELMPPPQAFRWRLQFGRRVLGAEDRLRLAALEPQIELLPDARDGTGVPFVKAFPNDGGNDVTMARLTTVVRVAAFVTEIRRGANTQEQTICNVPPDWRPRGEHP